MNSAFKRIVKVKPARAGIQNIHELAEKEAEEIKIEKTLEDCKPPPEHSYFDSMDINYLKDSQGNIKKPKRTEDVCPISQAVSSCLIRPSKKHIPHLNKKAVKLPTKRCHQIRLFDLAHELPQVIKHEVESELKEKVELPFFFTMPNTANVFEHKLKQLGMFADEATVAKVTTKQKIEEKEMKVMRPPEKYGSVMNLSMEYDNIIIRNTIADHHLLEQDLGFADIELDFNPQDFLHSSYHVVQQPERMSLSAVCLQSEMDFSMISYGPELE